MPAVTQGLALVVSPPPGHGVAVLPLLLQPRDLSRPIAPPRSCAGDRFHKQTDPFLFRRLTGKSDACLPSTCQPANPVVYLPEIMNDLQGKSLLRQQRVEFCRLVRA